MSSHALGLGGYPLSSKRAADGTVCRRAYAAPFRRKQPRELADTQRRRSSRARSGPQREEPRKFASPSVLGTTFIEARRR